MEIDYLFSYPDENKISIEEESNYLENKSNKENEIQIISIIDGLEIGSAGINTIGNKYKVSHRAEFCIAILKTY